MDISKFGHFYDFNLSTESLGQISVGTITGAIDEELRKRRNELYEASEREFGLILLQILGRKNVEEGNEQVKLGRPDVEVLTDTELARFADIFIDKNQWLFEDLDSPIHERHEDEEGIHYRTLF